jgi:hypothetical protein
VKKRVTLVDLGVDSILKWILKKQDGKERIGFIWLRIRKSGAVVYTLLNFRFPQNPWNLFTNSRTNSFSRGTFPMELVGLSVMIDYESAQQDGTLKQFCWQLLINVQHHLTFIFNCIKNTEA